MVPQICCAHVLLLLLTNYNLFITLKFIKWCIEEESISYNIQSNFLLNLQDN